MKTFRPIIASVGIALALVAVAAPRADAAPSASMKKRLDALEKLESARKDALDLIRDESRYNDSTKKTKVQDEVDKLTLVVEARWKPVFKYLKQDAKKLTRRNMQSQREALLAADESQLGPWDRAILRFFRDKQTVTNNDAVAKQLAKAKRFNKQQQEQIRITNEYRMLMGEVALAIDHRLVASAIKHSQEMTRLGYFDHSSPVAERRSPSKRAALEGFDGNMTGENIALGYNGPAAVHRGWLTSPGHHRNILGTEWDCMGAGPDGQHWTQVFGRTAPFRPRASRS